MGILLVCTSCLHHHKPRKDKGEKYLFRGTFWTHPVWPAFSVCEAFHYSLGFWNLYRQASFSDEFNHGIWEPFLRKARDFGSGHDDSLLDVLWGRIHQQMASTSEGSLEARLLSNNGDSQVPIRASIDAASLQVQASRSSLGQRHASGSLGGQFGKSASSALSPRARRGLSMSSSLPYGVSGEKEQADGYFSDLLSYR